MAQTTSTLETLQAEAAGTARRLDASAAHIDDQLLIAVGELRTSLEAVQRSLDRLNDPRTALFGPERSRLGPARGCHEAAGSAVDRRGLAAAGCVSVSVGSADAPAVTYYVLADALPAARRGAAGKPLAPLAIQGLAGDPLGRLDRVVFSRREGERAVYQFASWSERRRPSRLLTAASFSTVNCAFSL